MSKVVGELEAISNLLDSALAGVTILETEVSGGETVAYSSVASVDEAGVITIILTPVPVEPPTEPGKPEPAPPEAEPSPAPGAME